MRKLILLQVICLLPFMFAYAQFSEQENNNPFAGLEDYDGATEMYHNNYAFYDVHPQVTLKVDKKAKKMSPKTQFDNEVSEMYPNNVIVEDNSPLPKKMTKKSKNLHFRNGWVRMQHTKRVSYGIRYQPKMKIKESKKIRKMVKKSQIGNNQLAKVNFQLIPNKKQLTLTAHLNTKNNSIYHIKLINEEGQMIKSFPHLSANTIQKIQLNHLLPGKYRLSLYSGIERSLITTYDLKYY